MWIGHFDSTMFSRSLTILLLFINKILFDLTRSRILVRPPTTHIIPTHKKRRERHKWSSQSVLQWASRRSLTGAASFVPWYKITTLSKLITVVTICFLDLKTLLFKEWSFFTGITDKSSLVHFVSINSITFDWNKYCKLKGYGVWLKLNKEVYKFEYIRLDRWFKIK